MKHFGITQKQGKDLKLTRENYVIISKKNSFYKRNLMMPVSSLKGGKYEDDEGKIYTDKWVEERYKKGMILFDKNINYYASLDKEEFNTALNKCIDKWKFEPVSDLNEWDGIKGAYIQVLDEYKQTYVGVSSAKKGIKGRIIQHWNSKVALDQMPQDAGKFNYDDGIFHNKFKIDSFKSMDTTRIYALKNENPFEIENSIIQDMPFKFLLNHAEGGRTPWEQQVKRDAATKELILRDIEGDVSKKFALVFPTKIFLLDSMDASSAVYEAENVIKTICNFPLQTDRIAWNPLDGVEAWKNSIDTNSNRFNELNHDVTFYPNDQVVKEEEKEKGVILWFNSYSIHNEYRQILKTHEVLGTCALRYLR